MDVFLEKNDSEKIFELCEVLERGGEKLSDSAIALKSGIALGFNK